MTLYHYCSNKTLYSIISKKEIRFFSLSLSNDSMEGQLIKYTLAEMAKKDSLDQEHIQRLQDAVSNLNEIIEGLGFCLSEKKDLLSQWRGYADDASGVSIGFSQNYLEKLSEYYRSREETGFSINKVLYGPSEQAEAINPIYIKAREFIDKGAFKPLIYRTILGYKSDEDIEKENKEIKNNFYNFHMSLLLLIGDLFKLKSIAFEEELEWRLISLFIKTGTDSCSFCASSDTIKPYRAFPLIDLGIFPIEEVILGPKNRTPQYVIDSLLKQNNFNNVRISCSGASYR